MNFCTHNFQNEGNSGSLEDEARTNFLSKKFKILTSSQTSTKTQTDTEGRSDEKVAGMNISIFQRRLTLTQISQKFDVTAVFYNHNH